ncbi:MAG: pilus assembly protein TadG-related protein [Croceibacterium sp.]
MAKQRMRRFLTDTSGAVAAAYAIALPALLVIGGVGFDYSRMVSMDSELQNAADQAALAAVTQLDGTDGACQRAANAARTFVANATLMAVGDHGITIPVADVGENCSSSAQILFWQDRNKEDAATGDADAKFIEIIVDPKEVVYALTPIGGAIGPSLDARAMAGMGSSVCKMPPIMICSPDPTVKFDAAAYRGVGIVATGHSPGGGNANQGGQAGTGSNNTWAPGDFGFLQVGGDSEPRNRALLMALAYDTPPIDCIDTENNEVSTGNPQGLYDAINTRFDIYDFNSTGSNNVLGSCRGGNCSAAPNVTKDFLNSNPLSNNPNACKIRRSGSGVGWVLPDAGREYRPVPSSPFAPRLDDNGIIDAMGLPRDNCHYTSFNGTGGCTGPDGRIGDAEWSRADYYATNHPGVAAPVGITRYETYLWELGGNLPSVTGQHSAPACFQGATPGGPERRVLTVAVVSNCADLNGQSDPVVIDDWVDVFLVEPVIDHSRRWSKFTDAIYVEVIGKSAIAGGGTYETQAVRRDVPFLIQ